jgi:hypothetical protein
MSAYDVLIWQNGFWCFRAEAQPSFLEKDGDYRVLAKGTDAWIKCTFEKMHVRMLGTKH